MALRGGHKKMSAKSFTARSQRILGDTIFAQYSTLLLNPLAAYHTQQPYLQTFPFTMWNVLYVQQSHLQKTSVQAY